MFKKKEVAILPEGKIAVANMLVGATTSQFTEMIETVEVAVEHRSEAIAELESEVLSLKGKLASAERSIREASDLNTADLAFIDRIKELAGI
jgi:hypothetical protein